MTNPQTDIDDLIRRVVKEVLDDAIEGLLEVLLKEVGGLSTQILRLQSGGISQSIEPQPGTSGDIAELILAATARGGRFL